VGTEFEYIPNPEDVDRELSKRIFDDHLNRRWEAYQREQNGDSGSSWQAIDLHDFIFGDLDELVPAFLTRDDNKSLLYAGCTHSIHGETG
jgi:hypothetical protein